GKVKGETTIRLPRGVVVTGKITEKPSGKPVAGATVTYFPIRINNPNVRPEIASWIHGPGEFVQSGADGRFRAIVYPGAGHLIVRGPTQDYLHQQVGTAMIWDGKEGGAPQFPDRVVRVDLKPQTREHRVAITLDRGVTFKGRLVGPDGKPVT